eukprot:1932735-Rhodomonas_salina.5
MGAAGLCRFQTESRNPLDSEIGGDTTVQYCLSRDGRRWYARVVALYGASTPGNLVWCTVLFRSKVADLKQFLRTGTIPVLCNRNTAVPSRYDDPSLRPDLVVRVNFGMSLLGLRVSLVSPDSRRAP